MKTFATLFLLLSTYTYAGFRHPVEETGSEAQAIERTVVHSAPPPSSSSRIMPDRALSRSVTSPTPNFPPPPSSTKLAKPQSKGRIPKAAELPSSNRIQIPELNLPRSGRRDGLISMKPENMQLKGLNRPQIHAFLKHARSMPLPKREYTTEVRSREISDRFQSALSPFKHKPIRTNYSLSLEKIAKITNPPSESSHENMVKRINSLFYGLELRYPKAVAGLWELTQLDSNPRELQARDALFAGLLSERAQWTTLTALFLEESAEKNIDKENRYLQILFQELERVESPVHLENIVSALNPERIKETSLTGDNAYFTLAKRILAHRYKVPAALPPSAETFASRIQSLDLKDRLEILTLLPLLRNTSEEKREQALKRLKTIETGSTENNRQSARLAIARSLLQHGSSTEALALYQGVKKDGKNRLNVLAEQSYAEYMSGDFRGSLGKSVALQSPYFQFGFSPDIHLVEILSRKALCDFGGAEKGIARFRDLYSRELVALEHILASRIRPENFYVELMDSAGLKQPMKHQRYLLQLPVMMENQRAMNQALNEFDSLDKLGVKQTIIERPKSWDELLDASRQRWHSHAAKLREKSGISALQEVEYLAQRLRNTFTQLELLDLDISISAGKNYNLQSAMNFPARKNQEAQARSESLHWPFELEIWEDEIDFTRSKNPSKCAKAASL